MKSIILAGGSGSRLWPLSRDMYPKQLLALDDNYSLLQQTFMRLMTFVEGKDILKTVTVNLISKWTLSILMRSALVNATTTR